ncbi:coiled-coil domain-containing protein 43-like [Acanthaster planci]|uniref:Coiled-coil domain-containing protein 43 n=1 Tax=Acanthaster planci TaxID=133434 RepID=A0A8B7XT53_ACAPL|nr:coiled-coil domain-containing protein 43-like [Acanthaster planci]
MAAAMCTLSSSVSEFEDWLSKRLKEINIDDEVFGSYILGVVDTDDSTDEDKMETLMGILTEITEEPVEETCREILKRWQVSNSQTRLEKEAGKKEELSTDEKMSSIMERHASTQSKKDISSPKNNKDKQRLLARYAEVVDGESSDEEDEEEDRPTRSEGLLMAPNTNKESVDRAVREQREKQKAEHEKRREMERQQREKDRLKALERKEKEKKRTQKGERRR